MANDESSVTVINVSEDENSGLLGVSYSRSDFGETSDTSHTTNKDERENYDPEMSPAVMGYLLAQIFRNFQHVIATYEDSSNFELITQLTSALKALDCAKNEYSIFLSMLSDRDKLDLEKEIERHERVFMRKHEEILKEKEIEHQAHELLAVHAAKIDCKKELMECMICYQEEKDTVLMPCSHTFCRSCVEQMYIRGRRCAVCRGDIKKFTKVRFT